MRDGGAGARRPADDQGRAGRALPRGQGGRPGALRARAVRRLPLDRRRRARLDDRDVRRAAARHRELALVGRAVLHPHRQAAAGDADRAPARLQAPAAARVPRRSTDVEPNQLVVKLDPSTGIRLELEAHRRATAPAPIELDMEFADEGGEGADALRGAAARRDGRRQHPLHPPGRRRGDVAGHAAAARRAAAGAPLRAGIVGPGGGRRAVAGHGRWHGPWIAS